MLAKEKKAIIGAARAGGEVVRKYFGKNLNIVEKSCVQDFRTEADIESEKVIIEMIEKNFPDYNILSEECGLIDKKSEYSFYIDPLDGTNNFALGIPNFSVLIALVKGRETIFGVIYLPILDLTYHAEKNGGAFCGTSIISPNSQEILARSTVSFACGYLCPKSFIIKVIGNLSRRTKRVLLNWSQAGDVCLLASGKLEAVINKNTEAYDFLAAKLIAKEAGCVVTDLRGRPEKDDFNHSFIISNNQVIHKKTVLLV